MDLIREPRPGETLNWAWGAKVVRALRRMELRGGPGVRVSSGPNGTTVAAENPGKDVASTPYPFRISISTNPANAAQWLIRVNDGFVNGVPVTIDGSPLYDSPAPTLTATKGVLTSLYLEVTPDSAFYPDTVELKVGTRPADVIDYETPEDSLLRFSIGYITVDGVAVNTVGNNLAFTMTSTAASWVGV